MKTFLKIVIALVIVIGAIVVIALAATSGLPKAADAFFSHLAAGRISEAYQSTAAEFRASTTEQEFAAYVSRSALDRYERGRWNSRSIENKVGRLEGTVQTKDAGEIPVKIGLVKEGGAWKILSIEKAAAGLRTETGSAPAPAIPVEEECGRLVKTAVLGLADAIVRDDFAKFHSTISRTWQSQISAQELRNVFATFVERKIDLRPLEALEPRFSQDPAIDGDGILLLAGHFDSDPPVKFRVKFINEQENWRLFGINVNL